MNAEARWKAADNLDPNVVVVEKETLQAMFDMAVSSMDFSSNFLDREEVRILRSVAEDLGVDPMNGTPDKFRCDPEFSTGEHEWQKYSYSPGSSFCVRCYEWKSEPRNKPEMCMNHTGRLSVNQTDTYGWFCKECMKP